MKLVILIYVALLGFVGSAEAKVLISLTSHANNNYVRASASTAKDLLAARSGIGTWEVYEYIDLGNSVFALKSLSNGKFVTVENNNLLYANRDAIGPWEKFLKINLADGYQAIQSLKNGKYVVAESAGGSSLRANRDAIGDWERFVISDVVDIWEATTAFARAYPYSVKMQSSGYGLTLHKEILDGNFLWMYELSIDNTFQGSDPSHPTLVGTPIWNKYGLQYVGDWETFASFGTLPHFYEGAVWNIPRSRRYALAYSQSDSSVVTAERKKIPAPSYPTITCNLTTLGTYPEWGRAYSSFMKDLTNYQSLENMGNRWVIELGYKDTGERWTIDLGPSIGNFAPKYGVVGYRNGYPGYISIFANIQNDNPQDIVNKRCVY